ncbi:ribosome rescue protein RqcH [Pyrococcus kukulkanii]|uniref:Archaeal Rqc2 homolog aRqcH n=1 Tax=Pyrococcus kukulkanii TaxID=1609559 RepID=A0A127BDY7_9EURY|nr:ribosome rescue protein RqcH [Pyrococcus kukulkanii]AMM55029.1 fibronectin-binding protein [Pyrococcus kukulkanii]
MKESMTSVDVKYVVDELQSIIGSRVEKIYHEGNEVRIKLHKAGEGRIDLLIEAGRRIHVTTYIKENLQPTSFAMLLRKHLSGKFLTGIEQREFDRIVILHFGEYRIIAELFGKGNIVFVNGNWEIIGALRYEEFKDRSIKPKIKYVFPPTKENPLRISFERFVELMKEEDTEIVRALARKLSIGGLYSEEILLRAGIDKMKKVSELTEEDLKKIYETMLSVLNAEKKPNIVYKDGEMVDVLPIDLLWYSNYHKKVYGTFSKALDEYFGKLSIEKAKKEKTKALQEKKKALEISLKRIEEQMKGFEKEAKDNQEKGDLLYANYTLVREVLETIKNGIRKLGVEEVKKRIENAKKEGYPWAKLIVDVTGDTLVLNLEGKKVRLDINKSLEENAELFYEKAKKARQKLEGAKKAYEETKKKIESIEKEIAKEEKDISIKKLEKRKKKWFEKFRWFISSEGFLVIGGKDATTNEIVVKKYMNENDLYCHADIWGAPHVIVKNGQKAGDKTIFEACQFAVSMSRAWNEGLASGDAYWVYPNQVSKQAPAGEYLPKGAFMIYGKRNWLHGIPLKLAIGIVNYEGEELVMCGPVDAVKAHTKRYIVIRPGDMKKSELVKKIKRIFEKWGYKVPEEDIMAVLPPGEGEIVEVVE